MSNDIFPVTFSQCSTQQILADWIAFGLSDGLKRNMHCEVEMRLGEFVPSRAKDQRAWDLLAQMSFQHPLILRTNSK